MPGLVMVTLLGFAMQLLGCHTMEKHNAHVRSFDGTDLVYDAVGHGEPTLVFVHGWCCHRGHWGEHVEAFSKEYRVVALDLAGHGASSRTRTEWTLENFARDVEAVVTDLDLRNVILIGHSMGGPVVVMAAARMPDRVVGVVGVDTLHDAELRFPKEMVEEMAKPFESGLEKPVDAFFAEAYQNVPNTNTAAIERVRADVLKNDPHMAAELLRQIEYVDMPAILRACPVGVHCINSTITNPTAVETNRKYNPGYSTVYIKDVGHWLHLEKPREFAALLQQEIDAIMRDRVN